MESIISLEHVSKEFKVLNDKVYVPAEIIEKGMGYTFEWDNENFVCTINNNKEYFVACETRMDGDENMSVLVSHRQCTRLPTTVYNFAIVSVRAFKVILMF